MKPTTIDDPEVGHHETLNHIRSAASISMSPELFEKLYLSPPNAVKGHRRQTFGNPIPMGLAGFLLTATPVSCDLMGWRGAGGFGAATIPVYFFEGGVLMMLSGIMDWILGNSYTAAVFTSFGGFFLSFGGILHPAFAAYASYAPPDAKSPAEGFVTRGFNASLGFFMLAMALLSIIYLICALRTNVAFVAMFGCIVPALLCLLGAFWLNADDYTGNALLVKRLFVGGGALLFAANLAGWYCLLAILLALVEFPIQLPVGDLSNVVKRRTPVAKQEWKTH
ncbi:hypothetical protein FOPG_17832 [Fusarium oxysporum f. sp. conglutinans race 2 54008]|uniref:Protein alcS n=2 Tax=Fusarium oxysporum f. sp. conglutinans TaxID=100902 RepID=F9GA74_FUSOF|nr:hypothetical protein FOXB_15556 [Fusarium oxysporum f. sp. conglutinans Fo5176]EXL65970.1 hypothetical protein FOPG_17832 [Fusarium oxysporum f. sp. conglutinans race 2 54008]